MSATADDIRTLYRETVLEHSRNPRHFGRLADATHTADGINPLCGDKLKLYVRVDDAGRIDASYFEGSGCAISMASASLMTDAMTGLPVDLAEACVTEMTARLQDGNTERPRTELAELAALDGVRQYPGRVKCATLAWRALEAALHRESSPATTEQDA
jgi:nitrogen fixation NifU-like protein